MPSKKKDIPWSFSQLCLKVGLIVITVSIGLWCGYNDSYSAFYIATVVQALNNAYESFGLLSGYNRFITVFQVLAFFGAVVSVVIALFSVSGASVNSLKFVIIITILLSIPVLHFLIEGAILLISGKH